MPPWLSGLSRRSKWVIGSVSAATLVTGVCIVGAQPLADWLIGKVYQNVVPPDGGEMAVTVTSYPSSSHLASVVGGKGEGLNCSIGTIAKQFFPRYALRGTTATATDLFRQACVFHDLCYRHGLATYGYTQADCDQMLQEQAARICTNVSNDPEGEGQCQLNAKKVLAGVTNGGFGSYQSWGTSTYYEFDSSPASSERMSVARVIDHPFKAADPEASRNDPDQLLLTFEITRSNATVACRNCTARQFSPAELAAAHLLEKPVPRRRLATAGSDAAAAAASTGPTEFSAQEIRRALDDLVRSRLTQPRAVMLPSDGIYSAPHLLTTKTGEQLIVWLNRKRPENTVICMVIADPKHLMTHTRMKDTECLPRANERMRLVAADMFASSPQLQLVATQDHGQPVTGLLGTGLSMGKESLRICVSTNVRTTLPPRQEPKCYALQRPSGEAIAPELGAFQNFPIIKGERHIYLSRSVFSDPAAKQAAGAGRALVFDVDGRFVPPAENNVRQVRLYREQTFDIPDDYDPMLPLTKDSDLRFLSVKTDAHGMSLYEIDFESENPRPVQITTLAGANAAKTEFDKSWARRPILVLDQPAQNGQSAKTQIILSRSEVTTSKETGDTTDSARFEFVMLERDKAARGEGALRQVRGLTCNVVYTLQGANPSRPCKRSSVQVTDKRPSPAQMLKGAQLLVGRLTSPGQKDLDLALPDACYPDNPIILQPMDAAATEGKFHRLDRLTVQRTSKRQTLREVECAPLNDATRIAGPIAN